MIDSMATGPDRYHRNGMGTLSRSADILVVEDETQPGHKSLETLRGAGHRVRWVRTARDARAVLQERAPDVLVLDLTLETDGLELLQALRFSPDDPRGGIVVLVDAGDTHSRERAHQLGAAAVLSKPLDTGALAATVSDLVDWM